MNAKIASGTFLCILTLVLMACSTWTNKTPADKRGWIGQIEYFSRQKGFEWISETFLKIILLSFTFTCTSFLSSRQFDPAMW